MIAPTLLVLPLKEFVGAETDENYWVYQVKKRDS